MVDSDSVFVVPSVAHAVVGALPHDHQDQCWLPVSCLRILDEDFVEAEACIAFVLGSIVFSTLGLPASLQGWSLSFVAGLVSHALKIDLSAALNYSSYLDVAFVCDFCNLTAFVAVNATVVLAYLENYAPGI